MEEEVALQGVFKVRRNRDANAARRRLYFGKGFSSISGRQLGTEKRIWGSNSNRWLRSREGL